MSLPRYFCDYHKNTAGDQTLVSILCTVTLLTDLSPFTVTKQYETELRVWSHQWMKRFDTFTAVKDFHDIHLVYESVVGWQVIKQRLTIQKARIKTYCMKWISRQITPQIIELLKITGRGQSVDRRPRLPDKWRTIQNIKGYIGKTIQI
jgi:hypothetical protein